MELQELIKTVASGNWGEEAITTALNLKSDEVRQFSVAVMQRASQFSSDEAEAKACPLNSETAFKVRQNAFYFVSEALDKYEYQVFKTITPIEAARWYVRLAEYARRLEESKIEGRLAFGKDQGTVVRDLQKRCCRFVIRNPREAATWALAETASKPNIDRDTRMLLGYEQAYWLQLDGKYAEARETFKGHAYDCHAADDKMGAAIFELQAAKAGIDGKLKDSATYLVDRHEFNLSVLQEHRTEGLAKQWLEKIMPAHLDQAVALDAALASRAAELKKNLSLALEGKYEEPSMGH